MLQKEDKDKQTWEQRCHRPPVGTFPRPSAREVLAGGPFWAGGHPLFLGNGHMAGHIATGMDIKI